MAQKMKFGWTPDLPDIHDYTTKNKKVAPLVAKTSMLASGSLPTSVDLRKYCSAIQDQGQLGACTAHAGTGMVEYFEKRAFGTYLTASRLFLYKATRDFMQSSGDTGATLRATMGALTLFGVPPEQYYEYDISTFDNEPSAFLYSFADNYKATKYVRLDPAGTSPAALLTSIKASVNSKVPAMFGFSVYDSYSQATDNGGAFPFPTQDENTVGGHAIMVVGYDDAKVITNDTDNTSTTGALLIRNSWGTSWGQKGYGYLPYEYVNQGLAQDFWTILNESWVDTGLFTSAN